MTAALSDTTGRALASHSSAPPPPGSSSVERAMADLTSGRAVVVLDEVLGNAALVFAAERATPSVMAAAVRWSSGFVCVPMSGQDLDRLELPPMVATSDATRPAFTVAVDAASGVTTGISATDRAYTVRLLARRETTAADLARPGHLVPVRVADGGVLARPAHPEAAVDLCRLARLRPAAVECQLVSGSQPMGMADPEEALVFAKRRGLSVVSVTEIVDRRLQHERHLERLPPVPHFGSGGLQVVRYRSRLDGSQHVALVVGPVSTGKELLVKTSRSCAFSEILGAACGCRERLEQDLRGLERAGGGVLVLCGQAPGSSAQGVIPCRQAAPSSDQPTTRSGGRTLSPSSRSWIAAQVLADLRPADVSAG